MKSLETIRIEREIGDEIAVSELDAIVEDGKIISYAVDKFLKC
jgi:hypothetical protein